jgi:dTDP-4-amino-4,6-dideoxygalactose transaminase
LEQISLFKVFLSDEVLAELGRTFESGYIGQGSRVDAFEDALRGYLGYQRLLTMNSATSALHLALHLLRAPSTEGWPGLQDDDEVLTTPLTCVATNWPILANRLRIRWVDVNPEDLNASTVSIASQISPRTKIIMLVHWGGYPADIHAVSTILSDAEAQLGFRPLIIEDCAHALGATYGGSRVGSHGNMCAFSFQAVKPLTCGDGGALCLPTAELFQRASRLRWYGIDRNEDGESFHERDVPEWGFKFHMNDVNATIGLANLPHLDWILGRQRANAQFYDSALRKCSGVTLPSYRPEHQSSNYLYTIRVQDAPGFKRALASQGIEAKRVHKRNDWHGCVAQFRTPLAVLDSIYDEILCLPVGWWLSQDDLDRVVTCIAQGW